MRDKRTPKDVCGETNYSFHLKNFFSSKNSIFKTLFHHQHHDPRVYLHSCLKKLVVTFSLFIAAVVLYTLNTSSLCTSHNQEVSPKENLPFQSTRNATQLVQVDKQLMIFITSAPFYTSRKHGQSKKVYENSTGNFINYHTQTALKQLRAVFCKNRRRVCKIEKSDFPKLCQKEGLGELFLKI